MAKKQSEKEIESACESLCDELEQISKMQAVIVRGIYRDKASIADLARQLQMPVARVQIEEAAGIRSIANIVTGGALADWPTPGENKAPRVGESMAAFKDRIKNEPKAAPEGTPDPEAA